MSAGNVRSSFASAERRTLRVNRMGPRRATPQDSHRADFVNVFGRSIVSKGGSNIVRLANL